VCSSDLTFEAKITNVSIIGEKSQSNIISSGEIAAITVELEATKHLTDVNVGILIRDRFGQDIFGANLYGYKRTLSVNKNTKHSCVFKMSMNIGPGKYSISSALAIGDTHVDHCLHWKDNSATFEIAGNIGAEFVGISKLYPEITISTV
jgi:lipopolysaccharide transport system ATP-binding protein